MDPDSEDSIRVEIKDIKTIPYGHRTPEIWSRPSTLEAEIRRHHPELWSAGSVDCTSLRNALLAATEEEGFLCLSGSQGFPVSWKEATNTIPAKLLMRSFHSEVKLILQKLRNDHKKFGNNGGAIFFGPSGTGKSWATQAVLVDELRGSQLSRNAVVYFDSEGKRAFVFSKERSVLIRGVVSPNQVEIPELMTRDTVLIYDAVKGPRDPLTCFPCECLIFSTPNAGNFKHVASSNGLVRFICPNWTVGELQALERGYGTGNRFGPNEIERRFERFGGSPRAVMVNKMSISQALQARYAAEESAETPDGAYNKYLDHNVIWEYCSPAAKALVHAKYDHADEATKQTFESWLQCDSQASALYGYWFEHKTQSLFPGATNDDVEVKALEPNKGLSEDEEKNLSGILASAKRSPAWTLPQLQEIRDAAICKHGSRAYDVTALKTLTDSSVLYRLPLGFPLMDYYNPPNNCFSLGVGEQDINLNHAVDLCDKVVPATHQVNFVFVTPSSNYSKVRHCLSFKTGSDGAKTLGELPSGTVRALSRMVQFCMRFKKC